MILTLVVSEVTISMGNQVSSGGGGGGETFYKLCFLAYITPFTVAVITLSAIIITYVGSQANDFHRCSF